MIRFDKVSKVYESRGYHHLVLNNLNFTVERRTSLGICGANGSGKSTLMRLLAGVEYPTAGRVTRSMTTSWPLGYTSAFQASLTGADNVRFISRIYGKDARAMADFVEEFAALGPFFRQPINTYSAGMVARLAFGLSLAIDFECYLIDEVTATGDERFRLKSEKALHDRRDKAALVMVSHVPETLRAYCDRGAVLFNGSLTFYDTIDEAIEMHLYFQHAASRDAAINMDPPNDKLSRRLRKSR